MKRINRIRKSFLACLLGMLLGASVAVSADGQGKLAVPVQVNSGQISVPDAMQSPENHDVTKAFDAAWGNRSVTGTQWIIEDLPGEAWCRIDFQTEVQLFEIDVQNTLADGLRHLKGLRFEFSTGQTLDFTMTDSDERQTFSFAPVTTDWVKIHLLSLYGEDTGTAPCGLAEVGFYTPRETPSPGTYDLNQDGIDDMLVCRWRNHPTVFIADDGHLPWTTDLDRDWDAYFSMAFSVGIQPPETWNPERAGWGSYTLLMDLNGDGRFDDIRGSDFCYQVLDLDNDGDPDIERTDRYHGQPLDILIDKYFYDLDDDNRMNYLDWSGPYYPDEQAYTGDAKYFQDTAGNGFFTLVFEHWHDLYYPDLRPAWENPIAFYDLDDDGVTELVVRETDFHGGANGKLKESEVIFDIDDSATPEHPQSLDFQLSWIGQQNEPFDYSRYIEDFPSFRGLPEADFLFGRRLGVRHQTQRMWIPYFDAYKIGTELENLNWNNVFLLIDEDDDDVRWEEMFSPHEFLSPDATIDKHTGYDDHLGDRWEIDDDYNGKGQLYIGKFDGKIHLYQADRAEWTIDYRGLFKGSLDRPQEAPAPPDGLLYSVIRYQDTDKNGFIDTIEYGERRVGEKDSFKANRVVNLLDYATPGNPHPDVCELFDVKTSDPLSEKKVANWNGEGVAGLRVEAYDRMKQLFADTADERWSAVLALYQAAESAGLLSDTPGQPMTQAAMKAEPGDHEAALSLTDVRVKPTYKDVLHPETTWEKYRNAFFLGESVLADILANAPESDRRRLIKMYYSGQLDRLAREIKGMAGQ